MNLVLLWEMKDAPIFQVLYCLLGIKEFQHLPTFFVGCVPMNEYNIGCASESPYQFTCQLTYAETRFRHRQYSFCSWSTKPSPNRKEDQICTNLILYRCIDELTIRACMNTSIRTYVMSITHPHRLLCCKIVSLQQLAISSMQLQARMIDSSRQAWGTNINSPKRWELFFACLSASSIRPPIYI